MKKLFYVLAITAMTAFAACNDGEKTEETTPTETPATETPAPAQDTTTAPEQDTTTAAAQ